MLDVMFGKQLVGSFCESCITDENGYDVQRARYDRDINLLEAFFDFTDVDFIELKCARQQQYKNEVHQRDQLYSMFPRHISSFIFVDSTNVITRACWT